VNALTIRFAADPYVNGKRKKIGYMSDYEVVTARTVALLQERVREMMKKGLRPLGGVAMLHEEEAGDGNLHIVFAQAVARD
jgi:Domain of unknown function (DUF1737)